MSDANPTDEQEPTAGTAGEQDHTDPDEFRGDDADAPEDTGRPPQDDATEEDDE